MEENKNINEEIKVEDVVEQSVAPVESNNVKSFIKKNKKLAIIGGLIAVVIGGFAYYNHREKRLAEIEENMRIQTEENLHNASARKQLINDDLEKFKKDINSMDATMVSSSEKIEIVALIDKFNENLQARENYTRGAYESLMKKLAESNIYVTIESKPVYDDMFSHILETMVRLKFITIESLPQYEEVTNDAITTMLSNGIIFEIMNLR